MKLDQHKTPLFDAIREFIDEGVTPFCIPSHKMGEGINPKWTDFAGNDIFKMDLSELRGLDDLHQPLGAILEAQRLAADAWGAKESFFLVNGTSGGIVASICSVVSEREKLIVPRNAHKSVVFGLIISGALPVYITADIDRKRGLVGGLDPAAAERAFRENPGAKGLFAVSPTYHGVCSDMRRLIEITHAHNGIFIADEAHGNHVYFHEDLPDGALALGADIACQSTHKMSGSLTQSSMLHLNSDAVNRSKLRTNLQMAQNTSPSYLLQVSLDLARSHIATRGHDILGDLIAWGKDARRRISEILGISILGDELVGSHHIYAMEQVRFTVSARELGIDGYELYAILRSDYKIEIEFGDYFFGVCVMGLGTRKSDIDKLVWALGDISARYAGMRKPLTWDEELPPTPPMRVSPRQAYFAERREIPWADAKGQICAEMIVPYPPGIPAICPGEEFTAEVWEYLDAQGKRGRHLHGPANGKLDRISVMA
jgi:arginine/lysine/ornithine decarboxylase